MLSNILFGCEISHQHEIPQRSMKSLNKKIKKIKSLNFQNRVTLIKQSQISHCVVKINHHLN
jgi:hypothetical protein